MKNTLILIKNWLDLNLQYYKKVISFLLFFDSERDTRHTIFYYMNLSNGKHDSTETFNHTTKKISGGKTFFSNLVN